MFAIAVVGAGPCGLRAATSLQREGFDGVVLEEHNAIGTPVNCAGLISRSGVEELGLDVEGCLVNTIKGAKIYSPNKEVITVQRNEPVAYVIDRGKFDKMLFREAVRAGVEVRLNTKMIDIRGETIFVQHKNRGELLKAKTIIGADGVISKTRELMGLTVPKENFIQAYQVRAKGNFNPNFVDIYFGSYAKNFFAWVIPENNEIARVGLGSSIGNIKEKFGSFVKEIGIDGPFYSKSSALIPVGEPMKGIVNENMLLVGDSAFQTKASSGGGIITGLMAAEILAECVANSYKNNAPLTNYEKNLKKLNNELGIHWKTRQYFNSLSDEKIDLLFQKLKKAKIGEFLEKEGDMDKPSRFMGKLWRKPSMWGLFPDAIKFWRT